MSDLRVTIGADIAQYQAGMAQAGKTAEQFASQSGAAMSRAANQMNDLGGAAQSTSMRFMQMRSGISAARDGVMAFTLGGQAAERSLLAMGHHINSLVNETGSFKGAMGALASSLVGPGGIILGLSVAAELFSKYEEAQKKAAETQTLFQKSNESAAQSAGDEITKVTLLYDATQNLNLSHSQRLSAVKELQSMYPAYFGNLSQEAILAGKAANAYDALTQSLFNKAAIEGAEAPLKDLFKQLALIKAQQDQVKAGTDELSSKSGFRSAHPETPEFFIDNSTGSDKQGQLQTFSNAQKQLLDQIKSARAAMQNMFSSMGIGSLISKDDVGKIEQIRQEIKALQEDALTHPENKPADILRIGELKKQLEELNPGIKKSKDEYELLEQQLKKTNDELNSSIYKDYTKNQGVESENTIKLKNQYEQLIITLNRLKETKAAALLNDAKNERIKEFGSLFPLAKPKADGANNIIIDDSEYQKEQLRKQVADQLDANAQTRADLEDALNKNKISLKDYYGAIYYLNIADVSQKQKLYAEDSLQYSTLIQRKVDITKRYNDQIDSLDKKQFTQKMAQMREIENVFGKVFENAANQAISGQQNFFSALGQGLEQLAVKLAEAAAEALVLYTILSLTGLSSGASLINTFGQLSGLTHLIGGSDKPGTTALAAGGLVTKPTRALVGEAGPEAVIPLNRWKEFQTNNTSKGTENITVTHKISGADLLLTINRANKQKGRLS